MKDCELLQGIIESKGHHTTIEPVAPTSQLRLKLNSKWHRILSKLPSYLRNALLQIQIKLRLLANGKGSHDLIVHLQSIQPKHLYKSGVHWLIPNQEWFSADQLHLLQRIDTVVCKTRLAYSIFSLHHDHAVFTGFSSPTACKLQAPPPKSYESILHVAGNSQLKGTDTLIRIWRKHPEWPPLTVVSRRHVGEKKVADNVEVLSDLSEEELTRWWSEAGLAVLPSEVEGYGQTLVEAQSHGCIVMTTDAPPMNEIVTPSSGMLVPYASTLGFRMGTRYLVDEVKMEQAIEAYLKTDLSRLHRMSENAFRLANSNHKSFEKHLVELLFKEF